MTELISYTLSEVALAGVGVLSFMESVRMSDDSGRYNTLTSYKAYEKKQVLTALQVETAVNFIAAFVYSQMIAEYKRNPKSPLILQLRYADWLFTTPLLLISLMLFLTREEERQQTKKSRGWLIGAIVAALMMCAVGYAAELRRRLSFAVVSFALLAAAFGFISTYLNMDSNDIWVYCAILVLWAFYGFVWFANNNKFRNIAYNVLDLLAKVGFGLFLWLYIREI